MWLLLSDGVGNKPQCHTLRSTVTKMSRISYQRLWNEKVKGRRCWSCQLRKSPRKLASKVLEISSCVTPSHQEKFGGLLKKQSLYAFRAVSDSAFSTIIFELFSKGLRLSCFHASPLLFVGSELFIGSMLGMFSVVANVVGVVERRAEESRKHQQFLESVSIQLVADWDACSLDGDVASFDCYEIEEMVHWFDVLGELEGPGAVKFFQQIMKHNSTDERVTLARCLGRCQTRSNIVLCTLQQLAMKDKNELVRDAASYAIRDLIRNNVIPPPLLHQPENVGFISQSINRQDILDIYEPVVYEGVDSGFSGRFQFGIHPMSTAESDNDRAFGSLVENSFTPVDRMDVLDMAMFCGLGSVVMGLQVYCLYHAVDLPFRFVALGWLFGVGGLIIYPYSGILWQYLYRTTWLRSLFSELATFS